MLLRWELQRKSPAFTVILPLRVASSPLGSRIYPLVMAIDRPCLLMRASSSLLRKISKLWLEFLVLPTQQARVNFPGFETVTELGLLTPVSLVSLVFHFKFPVYRYGVVETEWNLTARLVAVSPLVGVSDQNQIVW
jgi:hypothetical protein